MARVQRRSAGKPTSHTPFVNPFNTLHTTVLTVQCRAIEQALLDMQDVCQPKKKMARKNSEQALDLLAH